MTPRMQRTVFLVAALSISGSALAVIATGNMGKNLVYYWSPTELHAAGDKALRRHHPPRRPGEAGHARLASGSARSSST